MQACRLSASDLSCRRGDRLLFTGLAFALEPGAALQVAGPNGIGKSSLIRILAGLLRPFSGKVKREGAVGLIDDRPALDEHQPLGKALAFWRALDDHGSLAHETIEMLGLAELLDVPVRYLSTGQRKRAALARLVGQQAAVWLLDEPLNALDTHAVSLVEKLVADHCNAGGIAVVASHQDFHTPGLTQLALAEFAP
jgi:heme exporter protein A